MKNLALLLLSLLVLACGPTVDSYAPPATPNPMVIAKEPLCASTLTPEQQDRMEAALARWNEALPSLGLRLDRTCNKTPWVRVDAEAIPKGKCGYTTPFGILFKSDRCMSDCVATHEAGHHAGLIRHAPPDESGAMSDGDRGQCLPSLSDKAILRRTYEGKVSR